MKQWLFLVIFLIPSAATAQSAMHFERGTMFAGGQIAFQTHELDYPAPTGDASIKTVTFMPEFGWFMKSYLAAVGSVAYQSISGDTLERSTFSVGGGIRLFQPLALLHIYIGVEGGFFFSSYEADDRDTLDFGLKVPLGLLVPLSHSVALDVGMRFTKIWRDNDHPAGENYHSFIIDVGYLGVQAFF
ncbi:MAG: hypothetical protein CVU59_07485 [Deltaproteobacteria bacterium HGW-Deltaproteobacteria-17]|nr:MAG: hypothetical protein CVU59_07485 [Deltaproteobacteria bacterium HGW-Deltaproteobacteria-17]